MAGSQEEGRSAEPEGTRAMSAHRQAHNGCAGLLASAVAATLLTGCASFSPNAGMDVVSGIAATELRKDVLKIDSEEAVAAGHARVRRLLASTLSVDAAVQI